MIDRQPLAVRYHGKESAYGTIAGAAVVLLPLHMCRVQVVQPDPVQLLVEGLVLL